MPTLSNHQSSLKIIKDRIDTKLNDWLCEMKPGYDDSITGFNEAWDIVRAILKEAILKEEINAKS